MSVINVSSLGGVLFAVLAALMFALWNLYMHRAILRGAGTVGYLFAVSLTLAAFFLPAVGWQYARGTLAPLYPEGLMYYLLAGLVTGSLAPFFSTMATRNIGAAQTTAIRLLDPLFAFAIGLLFLREQVSAAVVIGTALIAGGLAALQIDQRRAASFRSEAGWLSTGILFAIGASLLWTVGSALRKSGLAVIPSPVLSAGSEGLAGMAAMAVVATVTHRWSEVRQVFSRAHLDVWLSAATAAFGTYFLNFALQTLPLPVAVALRNTSPWFALFLTPVLLGARYRPGGLVWFSTLLLSGGMLLILMR